MKIKKHSPLIKSFKWAFEGIVAGLIAERNMKIHVAVMLLVIFFGLYFQISKVEWLVCITMFILVISLELINSAIEKTVDLCKPEISDYAKYIKDVGAGAVLVSAIGASIIGLLIFIPYL
jgi:diacylglycerol kinase